VTPRNIAIVAGNFAFAWPLKLRTVILGCGNASGSGQRITHYSTKMQPETEKLYYKKLAESGEPTAVICLSTKPGDESIAMLLDHNVPVILVDETAAGCSSVSIDTCRGGQIVGNHLVGTGRTNIAVVCGDMSVKGGYNAVQRLRGIQDSLTSNGIAVEEMPVIEVNFYDYNDGQKSMQKLIDSRCRIDAIFCAAGDDCATGLLRVCHDRKIAVPGQVALVGFDDNESAKQALIPLTTVRQSIPDMAKAAYEMASDPSNELVRFPRVEKLAPTLVVRESSPAHSIKRGAA
jgi:LacI family transcriptional regulator